MIIRYDSTDVVVPTPEFGYTVDIVMALEIVTSENGTVLIWDQGATYDFRMLKCNFFMSATETTNFIDIFQDVNKGRAEDVTFVLSNSGFFPFGPDKGDDGNFTCRLTAINQKALIEHPADYWNVECEFKSTNVFPSYSIPAAINEGELTFAGISNLRYPPTYHEQDIGYMVKTVGTYGGDAHSIDMTAAADSYMSTFPFHMKQPNAGRVINAIVGTYRDSNIPMVSPANSYPFGIETGGTFNGNVKLTDNVISVTHKNYNYFEFTLDLYKV